nr:unnamed protein product [Digitaria exilis]
MADKSSLVTSNAADDAHARSPVPEAATEHPPASLAARSLESMCGACLRFATVALVGYSLATTAWRARHDPGDLAFVAGAGALLAALLACLRRAERLTPESPAEERRRVQAAVWLISTVLSCAFAYRVAAIMPMAVAVLVCTNV